ncbi:MAG: site-specific integrase [Lacunisphaera sp.]|nr:site-specific integrase [Lacunisphaera sp.]
MSEKVKKVLWERTRVTNLVRNSASGNYYARVKVNGKLKWRTLKTKVFTTAELRVVDTQKVLRTQGRLLRGKGGEGTEDETKVAHYIACYEAQLESNSRLAKSSLNRAKDTVKTLVKTWPELPGKDVRKLTAAECVAQSRRVLKDGTGFIAPNVKTVRVGMSVSNFNKWVDALRGILKIAVETGMAEENCALAISRMSPPQKVLNLPSVAEFDVIVQKMATSGSKWSVDAGDLARLLAYTGARLREATKLRWSHLDQKETILTLPGTKTVKSVNRPLPLSPKLSEFLNELRERRGKESASAPIARVGSCLETLKRACHKVRGKDWSMTHHDLRHFFATRCIESGVDIMTLSNWLGHADGGKLAMQTYGHLRQEHSLAQAAKVVF